MSQNRNKLQNNGLPTRYFPVEYKRGKSKIEDWDRVQLCAQALCLEEMRGIVINEGAIWYWQERRRELVAIDESLRQKTLQTIASARELLLLGKTPPPTNDKKRCKACSLRDRCQPEALARMAALVAAGEVTDTGADAQTPKLP